MNKARSIVGGERKMRGTGAGSSKVLSAKKKAASIAGQCSKKAAAFAAKKEAAKEKRLKLISRRRGRPRLNLLLKKASLKNN